MGRVPGHVNRDDLTSAGMTALVQAQRGLRRRPRGVPFASYATTRIRGAILDELRSIDWASRSVRRRARDLDETRNQLATRPRSRPHRRRGRLALGLSADEVAAQRGRHRPRPGPLPPGLLGGLRPRAPAAQQPARPRSRSSSTASASPTWSRPSPSCPSGCASSSSSTSSPSGRWPRSPAELGVSESRVSQMRAEALVLLARRHEPRSSSPSWSPSTGTTRAAAPPAVARPTSPPWPPGTPPASQAAAPRLRHRRALADRAARRQTAAEEIASSRTLSDPAFRPGRSRPARSPRTGSSTSTQHPGRNPSWVFVSTRTSTPSTRTATCRSPQGQMSKSLEKLSSGFRINRAADDAAGLAISEGLRSQVGGLKVAVRNAQDGISVVQTAEGALTEVHSMLQRMSDLSVQATTTARRTPTRRPPLSAEFDQLQTEIDPDRRQHQVQRRRRCSTATRPDLPGRRRQPPTPIDRRPVPTALARRRHLRPRVITDSTTVQTRDHRRSRPSVPTLGAIQNRFEHTINNLNVAIENLSASESRIRDTDMASEMVNFTRSQILSQAGTAMLAQANQAPQSVLSPAPLITDLIEQHEAAACTLRRGVRSPPAGARSISHDASSHRQQGEDHGHRQRQRPRQRSRHRHDHRPAHAARGGAPDPAQDAR